MKTEEIETIMKLMTKHGVTDLKVSDLEIVMPLKHEPVETKDEISDEDLLFYSTDQ